MGRHVAMALALVVLCAVANASTPVDAAVAAATGQSAGDEIVVPGGDQALGRLFTLPDADSQRLLASLNRLLLVQLDPDDRWSEVPHRRLLVDYLADVAVFQNRFRFPLQLALEPKRQRALAADLLAESGYSLRGRGPRVGVVPREGAQWGRRRRTVQALGWDFGALADGGSGSHGPFDLRSTRLPSPLPFADWSVIAGRKVDAESALADLVRDQRLGLVLEGLRRLDPEVRRRLDAGELRAIYQDAPAAFYRYAWSLRTMGGSILPPGGAEAAETWEVLLGESLDRPDDVLRGLVLDRRARRGYLWSSLSFVPDRVARYYLGLGPHAGRKFLRKLVRRLDDAAVVDFDRARSGDFTFPLLVRGLPIGDAGLELPGGAGLWAEALGGGDVPRNAAELDRQVLRARDRRVDEDDFLIGVLTEQVEVAGVKQPVFRRFVRAANMFGGRADLLTPENVVLLVRLGDLAPSALSVLDELTLADPRTVTRYLLAVSHLRALPETDERELLMVNFQGGIEWIRALVRGGVVADVVLEELLDRWSSLHAGAADAYQAAPLQLAWLDSLVVALPPVDAVAPGRGPMEKSLLAALAGGLEPERFEWEGVEYRGERGAARAEAWSRLLARQSVPSADQLVAIHRALAVLIETCRKREVDGAHALATELAHQVAALPAVAFDPPLLSDDLRRRVDTVDRGRVLEALAAVSRAKKPRKLLQTVPRLEEAMGLLARELRPFFIAPAYLGAMAEADHPLFSDPTLVHKHLLVKVDYSAGQRRVSDGSWSNSALCRDEHGGLGSHVCGSLASVPQVLARYDVAGTSGAVAETAELRRLELWAEDLLTTPWHRLTPPVTGGVALALDVGGEVLERARHELSDGGGAHLDMVAAKVPAGRLAVVLPAGGAATPSERFLLGFAWLQSAPGDLADLPPDLARRAETTRATLGPDWAEALRWTGAATPTLDGSGTRRVGDWPTYEALENDRLLGALLERELIDFRLQWIAFLGRHGLPGQVGADLARRALRQAAAELRLETTNDWEGVTSWLTSGDESRYPEILRRCFEDGLYLAQL